MLLYGDITLHATREGDGREQEPTEPKDAQMPAIEGIAAYARKEFGGCVVLPDAAASNGVPEGKEGGPMDSGEEPGVGKYPAEILDAEPGSFGATRIEVKPLDNEPGSKVPDGDAALAVPDG